MITETVVPNARVFVLDQYTDSIREKVVLDVFGHGIVCKETLGVVPWGAVFSSREDAIKGMIARAQAGVAEQERNLERARTRVRKLKAKYRV